MKKTTTILNKSFDHFDVKKYSLDALKSLFQEFGKTEMQEIDNKTIVSMYFKEYFDNIGAKTILIEKEFMDIDYLRDFSEFYVHSHNPFTRECVRLHFFKNPFSKSDFLKWLVNPSKFKNKIAQFKTNYLGFVVVKPIPNKFIGKTILDTYKDKNTRYYPAKHRYEVNVFGIKLYISSIAFQEQDSMVAACATSALWSAFQQTGHLYHHTIPSPFEITKIATEGLPLERRTFPNDGLNTEQIAQAIRNVNLEPNTARYKDYDSIKSFVYASLMAGIPIIFGIQLYDCSNKDFPLFLGSHAVTITGFSLSDETPPEKYSGTKNFYLKSSRINKIYVHDDQVGPFTRMCFDDEFGEYLYDKKQNFQTLSTSYTNMKKEITLMRALPMMLMIPTYPKIRITFRSILTIIITLNDLISPELAKLFFPSVEWDIHLSDINDFKFNLGKETKCLPNETLKNLLIAPMPKYIWRAIAYMDNEKTMELLFDATDLEQGGIFIQGVDYQKLKYGKDTLMKTISQLFKYDDANNINDPHVRNIMRWFQNN